MSTLGQLVSRRYRWVTLLIILLCGLMIRLGLWQLDRLQQRQALNSAIRQKLEAPPLTLIGDLSMADPETLRFRSVTVRGVFDHSQEVALQGQSWQGRTGVHLITPLRIEGSNRAVLVDRGWIPVEAAEPDKWGQFATSGPVEITGVIQLNQPRPDASPWQKPETEIFRVDIERLQHQVSSPLLPLFIAETPTPGDTRLPYPNPPAIDLSNGPHLGYALQWFSFTLILAAGYLKLVRRQQQAVTKSQPAPLAIEMEAQ